MFDLHKSIATQLICRFLQEALSRFRIWRQPASSNSFSYLETALETTDFLGIRPPESFEFIPIRNMLASVIEPCRDRRHDPWLVSGSLTCSPALRSSSISPA